MVHFRCREVLIKTAPARTACNETRDASHQCLKSNMSKGIVGAMGGLPKDGTFKKNDAQTVAPLTRPSTSHVQWQSTQGGGWLAPGRWNVLGQCTSMGGRGSLTGIRGKYAPTDCTARCGVAYKHLYGELGRLQSSIIEARRSTSTLS